MQLTFKIKHQFILHELKCNVTEMQFEFIFSNGNGKIMSKLPYLIDVGGCSQQQN